MKLSQPEIELFFKLAFELYWGINQKHKVVPEFKKPVYGGHIDIMACLTIRDALWDNPQWVDDFLQDNSSSMLTEAEREILLSWRNHFIKDRFIVVKHLPKYSVFTPIDDKWKLYGVCGISDSIEDSIGYEIPCVLETVLLPFNGKIIYDGLCYSSSVHFGRGISGEIKTLYNDAKEKVGIIERIGEPPVPMISPAKKQKVQSTAAPVDTKGANVPKAISARYMEVAEIIESFCDDKMNDEYREICLRALQKLCRKRPSPLTTGKARTWACGIVYAIGSNNFIFDKSQPINMTADEISGWFGLSKSTAGNKATEISKLLGLSYFNTEFSLQDIINRRPLLWRLK